MSHEPAALFWEIAAPHLRAGATSEGTMMGSRCLRTDGQFVGMVHSKTGEVILKLPATRVLALIDEDVAAEFRPNGKLFREWACLPGPAEDELRPLIAEAIAFATTVAADKAAPSARKPPKRRS